jgi:hypothetical protein
MPRLSKSRTSGTALALAVLAAGIVGAAPANAAGTTAAVELFACSARPVLALATGTPAPTTPQKCVNDQVGGASGSQTVGGVQVQAVDAQGATTRTAATQTATATQAGTASATTTTMTTTTKTTRATTATSTTQSGGANASAASTRLTVGSTVIQIGAVTSASNISCTYSATGATFSFNGRSTVASVKINGSAVQLKNGLMTIPVSGGTLYLNRTKQTATGIVQQAAALETTGAKVTIGESSVAIAQTAGNPCKPA